MLDTLVHEQPISMGLQWAILNCTVVKGPLRAHVGVPFIRMGVMVKPL
jgi:hypothetical protein